jgi:hypothetical protein
MGGHQDNILVLYSPHGWAPGQYSAPVFIAWLGTSTIFWSFIYCMGGHQDNILVLYFCMGGRKVNILILYSLHGWAPGQYSCPVFTVWVVTRTLLCFCIDRKVNTSTAKRFRRYGHQDRENSFLVLLDTRVVTIHS